MQRGLLVCVVGAALLVGAAARAYGQTTVYHLHKELSAINSANKQLKTIGPDATQTAFQTVNMKNSSGNFATIVANFETQSGVPGRAGTIAAGSTVSLTLRMKVTALPSSGNYYPYAEVRKNDATGPYLCVAGGQQTPVAALTTSLAWYTFSCTTSSAISMTVSDRFFVAVNVWLAGSAGNHNLFGELDVETNADSTITIPNPAPSISAVNPTSGFVGQSVTVTGTAFGATQGSSTVKFNGTTATITSWGDTSIAATVPAAATTGPVVVTVNSTPSNGVPLTVVPHITSVTPSVAGLGQTVTIAGTTFGATQGTSSVTFNGATATPSNWGPTSIGVPVPSGATTGPVVVTVAGNPSNGVTLTVVTTGTISGSITRTTGGLAVSGATVQAVLTGAIKGTATSAANGTYSMTNLDPGTYDVRVSATGFASELRQNISVSANATTTLNVALLQPGSISGVVTQSNGTTPIVGASVALYQNAVQKSVVATDGSGAYSVTGLHPGAYTLQVSSVGYSTQEVGVTISENSNTTRNVSLQNAAAGQVTYVYDEIGRLVSVVDPAGNAATYRYDAVGNLTAIDRPGSAAVSVSEFTPNAGPVGATVLIYGTGFSTTPSSNTVTFNGSGATVTAATANQLTVTVPAGATTGPIGVTSPGGAATTSTSFTVTAANAGPPTITSFTPQIWNGTSTLTITGTNFDTTVINDRASVNGMASSVLTATTTSLNVQLPSVTPSGHVSVSTLAGAATSTNDFFAPPPGYSSTNIQSTSRMTVGGSQTLSFPVAGKYSLIVFDGTPGHHVAATISGVTLGSGTTELYDPSGHRTASNTIFIFYTGYVETTIAGTASYTLLVGSTGSATGDVTETLWDSVDLSGSITADGSPVTVSITAPAQNEYLTFSGVAGQRISLTAQNGFNPTVYCDLNVSILKPNRTTLVGPTCMEAGGVIDTTVLPVTGTYTLLVDPFEAATGNVTLRLFTVPADISGPITPGGPAVPVTTTTPGQNASLTFNGATGDRVSLLAASPSLTNTTFGCDLNVTILKPDGNPLGGATCMESGGFIDVTTLPATGVYTISIDMVAAAYGSLTFTLYSVPADVSGTITIGGAAMPMTISTPGQNGSLTFAANANQQISLQSTTTSGFNAPFSCDVDVRILKPDTTPLVNTTCMDGNASIGPTTIPTTGTYTIVVDPESASTGSITFTLTSAP